MTLDRRVGIVFNFGSFVLSAILFVFFSLIKFGCLPTMCMCVCVYIVYSTVINNVVVFNTWFDLAYLVRRLDA